MDIGNISSERDAIIQKVAQMPNELIQTVSTLLDNVIEQHGIVLESEAGTKVAHQPSNLRAELSQITTWDEWFDTIQSLPEATSLENSQSQKQNDLLTEAIIEKYNRKGIDISLDKQ